MQLSFKSGRDLGHQVNMFGFRSAHAYKKPKSTWFLPLRPSCKLIEKVSGQ